MTIAWPNPIKVLMILLLSCSAAEVRPSSDEERLASFDWKPKPDAAAKLPAAGQAPGIDQIRAAVERYLKANNLTDFELCDIHFFNMGLSDFWAIRLEFDLLVDGPPTGGLVLYSDFQLKLYTQEEFAKLKQSVRTPLRDRCWMPERGVRSVPWRAPTC